MDNSILARWRDVDASTCLTALTEFAKPDPTYVPRKDSRSTRWHASVNGHDVELLCTGPKFWDARAQRGGGGAVDMAMHLFNVDFKRAVALLLTKGI